MKNQQNSIFGENKYNPIEERVFLRPISRKIATLLNNHTSITPDQISAFGFLLTILTVFCIMEKPTAIFSIVTLLFLSIVFDKIDGDLARVKNIAGPKGQYVDGFLDIFGEVLLISAWAISFSNEVDPFLILISCASTAVFNYHGLAAPFYLGVTPNTHKDSSDISSFSKLAISFGYGRAKLFLAMIATILVGFPHFIFYLLPILLGYTLVLYLRNIFVKKLTKR